MIREVSVDGYRSLESLKIPIRQGLNIVVGPNGGGKTNILSLFEFLSRLSQSPVDEAVSSHGGIGRVFTRISDSQYKNKLSCAVKGSTNFRMKNGAPKTLWYTWEFEIVSSESYDDIQFGEQKLYINVNVEPKKASSSDLILASRQSESGKTLQVQNMVVSRLQHLFRGLPFVNVGTYLSYAQASRIINNFGMFANLSKDPIFSAFPAQMTIFHQIKRDIGGGQIFNIAPDVCKKTEDSSRPPSMDKNGAGLASTLHQLGRANLANYARPIKRFGIQGRQQLEKITSYVRLISDSIIGLETRKNPIDNTISVYVKIDDGQESVAFPLSQCSDGTVKWIALCSKIVTAKEGYSIEEPENFLHPSIQKEFLGIVRSESKLDHYSPFTLITTHSESMLNEAEPSEIILVWMKYGKTVAKRLSNTDNLVSEINRTEFGLGHYFASGAFEGD